MKITDAFWEKRNLGVSCKEIIIEDKDKTESLRELKQMQNSTEYLVIKAPPNRIDIYAILSTLGFSFIESSINLIIDVKNARLSQIEERINNSISYQEVSESGLGVIYNEIKNGIFNTDRIAVDSFFTAHQASNRYINWIKDEVKKGANVYEMVLGDKNIGFTAFKSTGDRTYYAFLGGLYKDYLSSGLGFIVIRKPIEEAIKRGGGIFDSYVSSNNLSMLNIHINQGFKINQISNVFIWHKEDCI